MDHSISKFTMAMAFVCLGVAAPASAQNIDIYQHDLKYSNYGAHTYARHINVTDQEVYNRVASGGLRCASKYTSLAEANSRINNFMYYWRDVIDNNWVQYAPLYSTNTYRNERESHYGLVYIRELNGWYLANATTVVVKKVPQTVSLQGWIILTSYPDVTGWCY
jgi:hypothetical protein